MKTLIKITFYLLIFLAHVYTVYHIQYNAGFMEETILAFTVGFMNSSEYTTYLNYLFDAFYCTLIALYFFSRWSSKEGAEESVAGAEASRDLSLDPEALDRLTTVDRVTEQQPLKQQPQHQQQQPQPQKSPSQRPGQKAGSQMNNNNVNNTNNNNNAKSKKGNSAKNKKSGKTNNNNWATATTTTTTPPSSPSSKGTIVSNGRSRSHTSELESLENGVGDDAAGSGAICGVTGSVATGDLRFSVASLTFFDVVCISFVFPLCLLAIYLGWNMQTSVEISWLSWRWLWGWWTERWTWWRIALCLLACVGITFLVKPRKITGKTD